MLKHVLLWILVALSLTPTAYGAENLEILETREFKDSTGRVLSLPKTISRVVPTGPASQLMLLSFAPEKLVGLSNPLSEESQALFPMAKDLPVFGQFYGNANLNKEALLAAKPDVIIDVGESKKNVLQDMEALTQNLTIPAVHIHASLERMPDAFLMLGALLNKQAKALELKTYTKEVYEKIQTLMEKQINQKTKVLYLLGKKGTHVLSKGAFHAQVLDMMADNQAVLSKLSSSGDGREVSLEQILLWNPEVLIYAPNSFFQEVYQTPSLNKLSAVQKKRVYQAPSFGFDWMSTPPSFNRYMGLIWLSSILYPQQTPFDIKEETKRFYQLFFSQDPPF